MATDESIFETVPVVLFVFNRADPAARVLEVLRSIRPKTLLVVMDGPRANVPADISKCAATQNVVDREKYWINNLLINRSETNLGLRKRVVTGLNWAFEHVDRAIILEDDCVPHPTFFRYCTELLEHYKDDPRVGVITGDNFLPQPFDCGASYYFSRYPHCWGWATWRRAWKFYDDDMTDWPRLRESGWLRKMFNDLGVSMRWELNFDRSYHREKIQSWNYPWTYSCWKNSMMTIIPQKNLVSNIGFGEAATGTRHEDSQLAQLPAHAMEFPLRHPAQVALHPQADALYQKKVLRRFKWPRILRERIKKLF